MKGIDRLNTALLILLAVAFTFTELAEADLHWHLLTGRTILEEGRVPRQDAFTYTSAGRPWIDLHWLFQASVAQVHAAAGWAGLDALKILLLVPAFLLSVYAARRRGVTAGLATALGLLAVLASQERFTLRPEAGSFLALAITIRTLDLRHRRPNLLWMLPPLLALWANFHALFAVGVAAIALVASGDALEWVLPWGRATGGERPGPAWRLPLVAGVAALATLLTPYGIGGWTLPAQLLFERIGTDNLYARTIAEFQPTLGGYGFTTAIVAFAILATLAVAAALVGARRARPADLLLLTAFLYLALLARRNVPLFALVAVPVGGPLIGTALERARRAWPERARPGPRGLMVLRVGTGVVLTGALLVVLGQIVSNRFYEKDGTHRYFGRGLAPGFYPEGAADFVLQHDLPGEAIHDLSFGGYLGWRWYPRRRTFIDGRLEVHDPALFARYLRLQEDAAEFESTARGYDARILLPRFRPEWAPLVRHLAAGNDWRPVYVDHSAAVFVRDLEGGATADLPTVPLRAPALARRVLEEIGAAVAESEARDPLPRFVRRFVPRRRVPVAEVNAALFFAMVGAHDNAERLFRAALAIAPSNPRLHYDLAVVLEQAGRPLEARAAYEAALRHDPGFSAARVAYALRLNADGDHDAALREWGRAERSGMLGPQSRRARGMILARRGRLHEATEDYRRAARLDPDNPQIRAELALLYYRQGLRDQATREIDAALALVPGACAPRAARARMRASEGSPGEAEAIYREALRDAAGCPEAATGLAALLASSGRTDEAIEVLRQALLAGCDPGALSVEPSLHILRNDPRLRPRSGEGATAKATE